VATIWNEVAVGFPDLGLVAVSKPRFRAPPKRIAWDSTTDAFRADVDRYLEWCAGADQFAEDARLRALAPRTLKLRRNQIHASVTALVESGVSADLIACLGDLVRLDHFRKILRHRFEEAGRKPNNFNRDLAEALIQIAREWVKVDSADLAELKRLCGKMPMLPKGLTSKNKRSVAQFDDPHAVRRLLGLPAQLWKEIRRDPKSNFRTLARAQAALAIAMLTYMPVRSHNLRELTFDRHVFLHEGAQAISSLEIPADEVKNKTTGLTFDISPKLAKMLIEYRDRIAPRVIGRRPERIFVNADGSPKSQAMVALLIKTYLRKRAGLMMTPHQFRHLGAKILLEDQPGAHELVRQFLGHKNLKTTTDFYAGLNTRRAGLHHQRLIEAAIALGPPELKAYKQRPSRWSERHRDDASKS
jgi:integrase